MQKFLADFIFGHFWAYRKIQVFVIFKSAFSSEACSKYSKMAENGRISAIFAILGQKTRSKQADREQNRQKWSKMTSKGRHF